MQNASKYGIISAYELCVRDISIDVYNAHSYGGITELATNTYDARSIEVLEGLEPVRKRPGMYIGGTDVHGLHHLVYEIVDNSVDEAMQGYGDRIDETIGPDGRVSVRDFARGIPVDLHAKLKVSALEVVMTTLHAG